MKQFNMEGQVIYVNTQLLTIWGCPVQLVKIYVKTQINSIHIDHLTTWTYAVLYLVKLDGVGPVDNRPSTDKLHHFVRKKRKKKK